MAKQDRETTMQQRQSYILLNRTAETAHQLTTPSLFTARDNDIHSDKQADKISFLEVKELYDNAYKAMEAPNTQYSARAAHKAKEMMSEAIKQDMYYRIQLARASRYQKYSKLNDFKILSASIS